MTKYNYTITGTKNNQLRVLDVQIDGIDQADSFKYLPSYIGERQEFDVDGIDNIEYKGKY